jgi:hypothetical protein
MDNLTSLAPRKPRCVRVVARGGVGGYIDSTHYSDL